MAPFCRMAVPRQLVVPIMIVGICVWFQTVKDSEFIDIEKLKKSMCKGWTSSLDACRIEYKVNQNLELPCTPDSTKLADWLTCTGCANPFNITGLNKLHIPNTSLEISSGTDSNTLKLLVKKLAIKTTVLSCYVHGQTNIQGIFILTSRSQAPGRFLPATNVSQVCALYEDRDLILSCRAGCFDPDQCTKTWMKDGAQLAVNKADVTVRESGMYACLDANTSVIMTINVSKIVENVMVQASQFCSYQNKPTTPEPRTAEVTTRSTSPKTTRKAQTLTSLSKITTARERTTTDGEETTSRNGDVESDQQRHDQANGDDVVTQEQITYLSVVIAGVVVCGVILGVSYIYYKRRRSADTGTVTGPSTNTELQPMHSKQAENGDNE